MALIGYQSVPGIHAVDALELRGIMSASRGEDGSRQQVRVDLKAE
jgi:hypothetical protein